MLFMFLLPAEEPGVSFFDFQRAEPTRVSDSGALCLDGGFDLLASVRSIMLLTSMKPTLKRARELTNSSSSSASTKMTRVKVAKCNSGRVMPVS